MWEKHTEELESATEDDIFVKFKEAKDEALQKGAKIYKDITKKKNARIKKIERKISYFMEAAHKGKLSNRVGLH